MKSKLRIKMKNLKDKRTRKFLKEYQRKYHQEIQIEQEDLSLLLRNIYT